MSRKLSPAHHATPGFGGLDDPALGTPFGGPQLGIPLAEFGPVPLWGGLAPIAAAMPPAAAMPAVVTAAGPVTEPAAASAGPITAAAPGAMPVPSVAPSLIAAGAASTSGLTINIVDDSSVTTASLTVRSELAMAANAAVQFFETTFTTQTPVTLTIGLGWGEVNGSTAPFTIGNNLGASESNGSQVSYQTVYHALQANQTSADQAAAAASLPTSDPTRGSTTDYYVSRAEEKALNILVNPPNAVDGYIGISSAANFTFDPNNRAVPGYYDAIGTIEHEISEVMGRTGSLGTYDGTGIYTPLDLFRYSAVGVRQLSPGAGNFSVTGQTLLTAYNNPTLGGDAADWISTLGGDAFGDGYQGVTSLVSATDVTEMNVLGYNLAATTNCFATGTRIRTDRGDIPIEALAPGDRVVTLRAGLVPIRWIGRRRIDCRRHPDPDLVRPLRIAPGAFAPGVPARPLFLSPDHAVAVGAALIPIRLLANGGSIAPDPRAARVTYFHIELDRHDLLLAEGLAAESYLDTGNRGVFENADIPLRLHPPEADAAAQARRATHSCLPLHTDPAAVEPVWRRLAARATELGFALFAPATTRDPALCLGFGAARLAPVVQADGRAVFVVPPGDAPARLFSRSAVPAQLRPWVDDRRRLGVRVRRIVLTRGTERIEPAPDDPRLVAGWWAAEYDPGAIWRWTDGAARLPLPCGGAMLEVWTGGTLDYPLAGAGADAGAGFAVAA